MITKNVTTKLVSIILALVMLSGIVFVAGTVTASAASAGVSLYSSNVCSSEYGARTYEIFIQTRDNARNQKVYVHYFHSGDNWLDARAYYYVTLSDGTKIWKATLSTHCTRYAIKYIADGVTYWDNNNGKNYNGSETIGCAPIAAKRLEYQAPSSNGYRIEAVLQNYAYHKNVFVRYTTDGWLTFREQPMSYSETNSDGTETWAATLGINTGNIPQGDFKYAICYRVNGNEYWANNFGTDYNASYYIYR